jgi:lysozyme family protein
MSSFAIAIAFMWDIEGGFTDLDGGTNRGITLAHLRATDNDINEDGVIDITDVEIMSDAQISNEYLKHYWRPNKLDKIINTDVSSRLFTAIIHTGQKSAIILMQEALADAKHEIKVDGIMGPETWNAINNTHPGSLLKCFRERLIEYYHRITKARTEALEANPELSDFRDYLDGWISRAMR